MYRLFFLALLLPLLLVPGSPVPQAAAFKTVEWTDLIPTEDLEALLNPPQSLQDIADGSPEDVLSSQLANALTDTIAMAADSRYQQALASTRVKPEFNQQKIRIAGFIVPLQFDDDLVVTEFFLVPYFGACIHVPPPPPNQIIHVVYAKGIKVNELYDPFWIEGVLETRINALEIGTSAYGMTAVNIEPYTEPGN